MYLSRLDLHGFKSFAQKTSVDFSPGVTAIVGPNGCGKCVVGETPVTLADGRQVPIRQLVDDALAGSAAPEVLDDGTQTLDNPHGVRVLTLDPETLRLEARPVGAFVKRTAPASLLRVRTRAGREVVATPYHPLFTLADGRLRALRADELRPGTRIALPRQTAPLDPPPPLDLSPERFFRALDTDDRVYLGPSPRLVAWADRARAHFPSDAAWERAAGVPARTLSSFRRGQALNAASLVRLGDAASAPPPWPREVQSRRGGRFTLPRALDADLARWLGLFIAEGHLTQNDQARFVNSDPAVCDAFAGTAERLGLHVTRRTYTPGCEDLVVSSRLLCLWLDRLLGQRAVGSARKRVPDALYAAPPDVQWAFLSGLFEGDGYVSGRRPNGQTVRYLEYATASEDLARGVVALLLRLGVWSTLRAKAKRATNTVAQAPRPSWSVYVYGHDDLLRLADRLAFVGRKQDALDGLRAVGTVRANTNHDTVPGLRGLVRSATRSSDLPVNAERHRWPRLMATVEGRSDASRDGLREMVGHLTGAPEAARARPLVARLQTLADSDVYWDTVASVEPEAPTDPWVYDLCVPGTHNFVAGEVVVHNSNVIDAVRWVLGEQRSRLLRSESMAGVLFNGSAGTKPLGLAEVSLTVENTRGVLPTEYSEVTVTRRLYRNGDSEYLLNGTVCRLRDVLDLFMDTGMGAGAYSVIELSMVEDILSEQADDRRRLFEEAAGVTKYKRRRAQALKRLDATQSDLTRLDDIIEEVDKQVRSLSRQAQKAARHERLATRLRRLELALAAHDVERLQAEREALEATARDRGTEAEGLGAQVATGEAQIEEARAALVGLEQDMGAAARALRAHAETVQTLEAEIRLGDERQSAGRRALDRIARERDADEARAEDARRDEAAAGGRIETAEATLAERDAALAVAEGARVEARDAAEAARQAAQSARATAAEATAALRDAERAVERARDRHALLTAEAERVEAERAALAATPQTQPDRDRLDAAEATLADAAQALDTAVDERDAARDAFEATDADRQRARAAVSAARAQADLLQALVDAGPEGDGAVAFLAAHPDVDAPPLAEVVGAAEGDRLALDAALGVWAQALVVPDEDAADAAIGRLRAAERGRATFLVLSRVGPPSERSPAPPGTTPALDLARADARFRPLLQALLGNTFVVGSLAEARALRDVAPAARFVTREGAWANAGPAVHGGSATPSAQAGRLGVRERQAEAADALAAAEQARDAAEARAESARADRDAAEQDRRAAEAARDAAREARDAARDAATRADAQAAARASQLARLAARADEIRQQIDALPDTDALDDEVAARQTEASDAQARQATADAAHEAATAQRQAAETAWSDARLAHARAQSAVQAARDDRDRAARTLDDIARRQADRDAEAERLQAEIAQAVGTAETVTERLDAERRRTDALQTTASDAETAVLQGRARIADAEHGLREVRHAREAAATARADAERRLAEVATRQETTLERLDEEHGADLDEASAELDRLQAEELFQPDTARVQVPDLRQKIRALGAVNALALESYETEQERLAFLQDQRADLASAEASLLETIREINETARARFDETFGQVRQAFQKIFSDLFGGDATADVALDGDDALEAPVTITAQPKGKRPVSLTQLSGGEKTLTATALLFAIYLVKPSPFCILDEVDAPLDDANVGRFMRLIRSFADTTQFILVTHNKLTMEAADRMYGVTMPTPGVSRLVGVRFDEAEAVESGG